MGATTSTPFQGREEHLNRLGASEHIPPLDIAWQHLLRAPVSPLATLDPRLVEEQISPACNRLLEHNPDTSNFQILLMHTISLLNDAKFFSRSAPTSLLPASNALHLVNLTIKRAAQRAYSPSQLIALFEVPEALPLPPGMVVKQGQSQLMKVLIRRVLATTIEVELCASSYLLHYESLLLLVTLCSPALYCPSPRAPLGSQPLLDCLHQQSQLAGALVQKLLQLFLQQPLPPSHERPWQAPELLHGAAQDSSRTWTTTSAASMFWSPLSTSTSGPSTQAAGAAGTPMASSSSEQPEPSTAASSSSGQLPPRAGPSPLGDLALQLLLLLAYSPEDPPGSCNPFRRALSCLEDSGAPAPATSSQRGVQRLSSASSGAEGVGEAAVHTTSRVQYKELYGVLCGWGLSRDPEPAVLLLYFLLHWCVGFRHYALGRTDVESLMLPLLQRLYECPIHACSHAFMLQILLLILSQSEPTMQAIQNTPLPAAHVSWYREQSLGSGSRVSLGSVMVLVLVKAVTAGFGPAAQRAAASDPLPVNALAALTNLAPCVVGMHHHAAQRVVGLFKALARRQARLQQQQDQQGPGQGTAQQQQLSAVEDFMQVVLEVMVSALESGPQRNPDLVYALLQHQEVFAPFATHPRMYELVAIVQELLQFFNKRLEEAAVAGAGVERDVAGVLEVVAAAALFWRPWRPRSAQAIRFVYEEEGHPEDFFMPYVWALLVPRLPVCWDTAAFQLIPPPGQHKA